MSVAVFRSDWAAVMSLDVAHEPVAASIERPVEVAVNAFTVRLAVEVGGQAVLGRQNILPTPWLTERHGYDPTCLMLPMNR